MYKEREESYFVAGAGEVGREAALVKVFIIDSKEMLDSSINLTSSKSDSIVFSGSLASASVILFIILLGGEDAVTEANELPGDEPDRILTGARGCFPTESGPEGNEGKLPELRGGGIADGGLAPNVLCVTKEPFRINLLAAL